MEEILNRFRSSTAFPVMRPVGTRQGLQTTSPIRWLTHSSVDVISYLVASEESAGRRCAGFGKQNDEKPTKDPIREDRIHNEAIVDAYGSKR